jgi:hypothetical protein
MSDTIAQRAAQEKSQAPLEKCHRARIHPDDLKFVLRTLTRLKRIADKVPAEQLAAALVPRHLQRERFLYLSTYLRDIVDYAEKFAPKQQCCECGKEFQSPLYNVRSDARYCSRGCRQKAYRKRVTARASPAKAEASQRDGTLRAGSTLTVTGAAPPHPLDIPPCLRRAP